MPAGLPSMRDPVSGLRPALLASEDRSRSSSPAAPKGTFSSAVSQSIRIPTDKHLEANPLRAFFTRKSSSKSPDVSRSSSTSSPKLPRRFSEEYNMSTATSGTILARRLQTASDFEKGIVLCDVYPGESARYYSRAKKLRPRWGKNGRGSRSFRGRFLGRPGQLALAFAVISRIAGRTRGVQSYRGLTCTTEQPNSGTLLASPGTRGWGSTHHFPEARCMKRMSSGSRYLGTFAQGQLRSHMHAALNFIFGRGAMHPAVTPRLHCGLALDHARSTDTDLHPMAIAKARLLTLAWPWPLADSGSF
ncbi:hypothetical protein FH972_021695 [Carpinus fangiana]|uniref:Uncharacterized protein n=1 Tax=Carpinus fangiana TaxID=176857 RepID=A0A5N6KQF3_9ROSI|nr:hypothetical protein FH972_021695 [Carpinus fangiana]